MNYKEILLIKEGIKIFGQKGFSNLRITDLEKQAGIPKGTFFEFFDTTEKFAQACYEYEVERLLKSNTEYFLKLEKGLSFPEIAKEIWFNVIAWLLNEKESLRFTQQFKSSKYYLDNPDFVSKVSKAYIEFSEEGQSKGFLKSMPSDFMHELAFNQILTTVEYIQQHPKLISDKDFLAVSFDSLWESIRSRE